MDSDEEENEAILMPQSIVLEDCTNESGQSEEEEEEGVSMVDGPGLIPTSPRTFLGEDVYARLFGNSDNDNTSRRSSYRSSTTSIDTIHLKEITSRDRSNLPSCQKEMEAFAKDLAEEYKKSSHLREVLRSSWVKTNVNHPCSDENGNTLLHVAVTLNEYKLVSALPHLEANVNLRNGKGESPLHLAVLENNTAIIESLLKHKAETELENDFHFTPLQLAALKGKEDALKILIKNRADHKVLTPHKESLMHLLCRGMWTDLLKIREDFTSTINSRDSVDRADEDRNFYDDLERGSSDAEDNLQKEFFPSMDFLLQLFESCPELILESDTFKTSPGTLLHYFACLNYIDGTKNLLKSPYNAFPSHINSNGLTPLLIATKYNHIELAMVLLNNNANPNDVFEGANRTPLYYALEGFHEKRLEETYNLIKNLLDHGADPTLVSKSGETPVHLAIGTKEFMIMSLFVSHLGPDYLQMQDDSGITLFHYAVGILDEHSIYNLIEKGANLMWKASLVEESSNEPSNGDALRRSHSIVIHKLPLQEALKNGNSKNYFNAIRRMNFEMFLKDLNVRDHEEFLCSHLIAATREVRPDIVRLLFLQIPDEKRLHRILLFHDKTHIDETFRKTALEWAVENNDRLCTTEILHQEYECHRNSKENGLKCLRRQLTGDELLNWTIETFSMFYDKTLAQRTIIPLLGLIPLFLSIFSFVYDYYSDIELTLEYYDKSSFNACEEDVTRDQACTSLPILPEVSLNNCSDYTLTPEEYRTAFCVNIVCVTVPLTIFWTMCARELLPHVQVVDKKLRNLCANCLYYPLALLLLYPSWVLLSLACAPFFVVFVAARQVYYKFRHRRAKRKNLFREQLQKSEYYWGIARTAEAGLESCGQLILQVWLLSSSFKLLSETSFWGILDHTYNGVLFFLTFSNKPATEIEKSLGKIAMSLFALVIGVSACYRTLKRGAINFSNTFFIYISLFLQVFARIFSIGLYFFAVRSFIWTVPFIFLIHFFIIFIIKFFFERARHSKGILAYLVAILNVFASSLVFVRIVPIKKPLKYDNEACARFRPSHAVQEHSTFFVQFLFFALVLIENLILASVPLVYRPEYYNGDDLSGMNRALDCLGREKILQYVGIVFFLCACSWIFHILYYKYMGHPWSDINGPSVRKDSISFYFHFRGVERYFKLGCETRPDPHTIRQNDTKTGCLDRKLVVMCRSQDECDNFAEELL